MYINIGIYIIISNSPLLESLSLDEESDELLELELELELSDSLSMLISVMGGGTVWKRKMYFNYQFRTLIFIWLK